MKKKNKSQLLSGTVLSYIQIALSNIISILYTPIMLSYIGQDEYGLVSISTSVLSYLSLLNFGISASYIKFYFEAKKVGDEKELNGTYLSLYSIIAALSVMIGVLISYNCDAVYGSMVTGEQLVKLKYLTLILTVNTAISFPSIVFTMNIQVFEKYSILKGIDILKTVLQPLIVLPLLILGYKSIMIVSVSLFLSVLGTGISFWYVKTKLGFTAKLGFHDVNILKKVYRFSFFVFLNEIVNLINLNIDRFILIRTYGAAEVSIYAIGSQFYTYYSSFATSITNVFVTRVNKLYSENSKVDFTSLFCKVAKIELSVIMLILSGFIIFGKQFIKLWVGSAYEESFYIAVILLVATTIPISQTIGVEIQKAKNIHQFRSVLYFFIAILNLVISIPLAKKYSGIGCAIGTAISFVAGNTIIMDWYYHKKVGIRMKCYFEILLKFILCDVLLCSIWKFLPVRTPSNFSSLVLQICVFSIIYLGLIFVIVAKQEEKKKIISILKLKNKYLNSS